MFKVVIAQPIYQEGVAMLLNQGYEVVQLEQHSPEALAKAVADADALFVRDALVTREVIQAGPKLKVISRHGAGLERIDVQAATEAGVRVTRTPIANSVSVAEHVMAMLLGFAKNLIKWDGENRRGNFNIRHELYGFELAGRTLGILGLGNIGSRLAKRALYGLEMRVIGYDPYVEAAHLPDGVESFDDWRQVLKQSDFISLHLPLTDETRGMIGMDELKLMKPSAYLINCARGPVVKENELVQALREGVIAGAGVDVYDPDPPALQHAFFSLENTIVTPHSAAHTNEAMTNMATQGAQGIIEVLSGKEPTWAAN